MIGMKQLISLLLVSFVLGASFRDSIKTTVRFSERTKDVDTSERIIFQQGFKWAGGDDFNMHYQSRDPTSLDKVCDSPNFLFGDFGRCLTVSSYKYRFGDPVQVSSPEPCLDSACVATVTETIPALVVMDSEADIGWYFATELASKFIPGHLHFAKGARSKARVSFPFKGPGVATISFKPICYLLTGTFTLVDANLFTKSTVENNVTICVPLTLRDGTLDGIYSLKVSNLVQT